MRVLFWRRVTDLLKECTMAKAVKKAGSKKSIVAPSSGLPIDIGISAKDRAAVVAELSKTLADTYTLYLMTHNFHWNVTGPMFSTLHQLFMTQYTETWQALDAIAERIRALGHYAPGTYAEYARLSSIAEPSSVLSAEEMLRMLVDANEAVARTARKAFQCADSVNDQPTADLLTQRLDVHEKNTWKMRSLIALPHINALIHRGAQHDIGKTPVRRNDRYTGVSCILFKVFHRRSYERTLYADGSRTGPGRRHDAFFRGACRYHPHRHRGALHRGIDAVRRHGQ